MLNFQYYEFLLHLFIVFCVPAMIITAIIEKLFGNPFVKWDLEEENNA